MRIAYVSRRGELWRATDRLANEGNHLGTAGDLQALVGYLSDHGCMFVVIDLPRPVAAPRGWDRIEGRRWL